MKKYLLPCFAIALGVAQPAAAQTGRIAHFSHSGSAATLGARAQADDNFGEPHVYFIASDSIRYLSPRTALGYGHWSWERRIGNTDTMWLPTTMSRSAAARYWHQLFVKAKLIGFDSAASPARQPQPSKRSALGPGLPTGRAGGPGTGLALLALAALAGAGWLLASKPTPLLTSAA